MNAAGVTVLVALLAAGAVVLAAALFLTVWVAWRVGTRAGQAVGMLLRPPPKD